VRTPECAEPVGDCEWLLILSSTLNEDDQAYTVSRWTANLISKFSPCLLCSLAGWRRVGERIIQAERSRTGYAADPLRWIAASSIYRIDRTDRNHWASHAAKRHTTATTYWFHGDLLWLWHNRYFVSASLAIATRQHTSISFVTTPSS